MFSLPNWLHLLYDQSKADEWQNELDPLDMARKEIPLSEVLPQPAGGLDTGLKPPSPPLNIG